MPIQSRNLKESPSEIVVVCLEYLEEECRQRVNGYRTTWFTWYSDGVQKFYEELAKLEESTQDKCLDAILDGLATMQGAAGVEHIKETLEEGNADLYRISSETSELQLLADISCCCGVLLPSSLLSLLCVFLLSFRFYNVFAL